MAEHASTIVALWREEELPIKDGLYTAEGTANTVTVADGRLAVGEEFDLDAWLAADPEWRTSIMVGPVVPIADGFLATGEGANGAEGFFARLDADRNPVWVVYFEDSNPFTTIDVTGDQATFTSTSGVTITVDLADPRP